MRRTPPPPDAVRPEALDALARGYSSALATGDLRRSRAVLADAAVGGIPMSRLYEDVARPALHAVVTAARRTEADGGRTERLAVASVHAALREIPARLPEPPAPLRDREALVALGGRPLERLDGEVVSAVLGMDGWSVTEIASDAAPEAVLELALRRRVELVVLPATSAVDLLLSAPTCTLLRRLPDPPLLVACGLAAGRHDTRARSAGADAYASDLDGLLEVVGRMLPEGPARRWGVRLARRPADTLTVAPTGTLDCEGAARLRDVVESRDGSFRHLVIDFRDLAEATAGGLDDVARWTATLAPTLTSVRRIDAELLCRGA